MYVDEKLEGALRGLGVALCMQDSLEKSLRNYGISGKCLILLRSAYTVEINFNYFPKYVYKNTHFWTSIYIGVVFI